VLDRVLRLPADILAIPHFRREQQPDPVSVIESLAQMFFHETPHFGIHQLAIAH